MTRRTLWLVPFVLAVAGSSGCTSEGGPEDNAMAGTGAVAGMNAAGTTGGSTAGTGATGGTSGAGGAGAGGEAAVGGTAGAGGAGEGGAGAGGSAGAAGMGDDMNGGLDADGKIIESCRGFSFEDIVFSPGGDVLPNTCAPYHPTTNNPYALRCVDVWPWYDTGWSGDQFCILPPPADKGVQYGVHPQGTDWFAQVSTGDMSGYERANVAAGFILAPGGEGEFNYATVPPNTEEIKFYRNSARMRSGSHHMIVSQQPGATQAVGTWQPGDPGGLSNGTSLPGAQRPDENSPKTVDKPTEDAGYYSTLPTGGRIIFDMHHFNPTDADILKEAWTNVWFESDATVPVIGLNGVSIIQVATMNIPPGAIQNIHHAFNITAPTRLLTAFGHRHAWTTNFSAWVEEPGGATEVVYQSFDWYDEPTYRYDSLAMNPTPDFSTRTDGATSGVKMLMPGQKLHFNCHIEYTDERAVTVNSPQMPAQIGNLRFANQAFTAEMCILFGSTVGSALSNPGVSTTALPAFATAQ